jgi:hypothetical protein
MASPVDLVFSSITRFSINFLGNQLSAMVRPCTHPDNRSRSLLIQVSRVQAVSGSHGQEQREWQTELSQQNQEVQTVRKQTRY